MVTGSIPTENLPTKSHDQPTKERRTLVRVSADDMPSASTSNVPTLTLKDLEKYVFEKHMLPWTVELNKEESTKFVYSDESHSIPKFTVYVNANLEFTVYVYNWPIPDDHSIYQERKRCLKALDGAIEMLSLVTNSNLCPGLPQDIDAIQTVAVDPTWSEQLSHCTQCTVIRRSVFKSICDTHFQSDVSFRSPDCEVILENISKEQCKPCSMTINALRKAETRKRKVSTVPAKSKASLAACGPEKLVATVKASRLQNKQLEERIKLLEDRIQKDGVGVSEGLENDILKIMGGQNLQGTPHMKFFLGAADEAVANQKSGEKISPANCSVCIVFT